MLHATEENPTRSREANRCKYLRETNVPFYVAKFLITQTMACLSISKIEYKSMEPVLSVRRTHYAGIQEYTMLRGCAKRDYAGSRDSLQV